MSERVAIWNPASGSAPSEAALRSALGDSVELVPTTADDPGPGQARAAVARGADAVIACGGDGTVRACIEPLLGTDTALGIVPLGTGNLLGSNLSIPSGLAGAGGAGVGPSRAIDVGRVNGEPFAVMAGSGFDAYMIRDADKRVKSRFGAVAYVLSGLKHLENGQVGTKIEVDGELWFDGLSSLVLVGNFGTVSGGVNIFPDASPDDGLLDVMVVSATSPPDWAEVSWCLMRKARLPAHLGRRVQGRHITVTHDTPRAYELDGEDREPTARLEFVIEPSALTIRHEALGR